jgi:hypothetical protein
MPPARDSAVVAKRAGDSRFRRTDVWGGGVLWWLACSELGRRRRGAKPSRRSPRRRRGSVGNGEYLGVEAVDG